MTNEPDASGNAGSSLPQSANSAQNATFEAALAQLGDLVAQLESGALGLSESIDAYERGVTILRRLHEELAAAEQRVSVLVRIGEDGRPVLAAHESMVSETPASATAPPAGGSRGKGRRTRSLPGMDEGSDG
ncbi:MAG: exodeoxyribonuclease VII small subunit [Planctomycetota bacterium]|jgi:exodeoxyribonuclease VII small subunit|nr:MAG: exodeoxyribonuclease VII small subunit [Planctomycetota bacterium]